MPAPERLTVEAFLERWLADAVSRLDQYTVKNYTTYVRRHIIPAMWTVCGASPVSRTQAVRPSPGA